MIKVALMIEGQDGLNWPRWQAIARTVEDAGYNGLFRSDHFTNASGPAKDALELWTSLTWLATNTSRIEFGPLVSPVSFRHPVITAWTANAVNQLSSGRLQLGLGAGWQEREHQSYAFDLLEVGPRFQRFEEALTAITELFNNEEPFTRPGGYYPLQDAFLTPRPGPTGPPKIVIGGNGPRRTLPLVARFADEWNAVFATPTDFAEKVALLDDLLGAANRSPSSVKKSVMNGIYFGRDEAALRRRLDGRDPDDLRGRGAIVGSASEVLEHLAAYEEAGADRIMAQWLALDDLAGIEELATLVQA